MKTTIPFKKLNDRKMKVGDTFVEYASLRLSKNIVFEGIPTEDDFRLVIEENLLDRVVIDLEICKFVICFQSNKFWLVHEYSQKEGISSFMHEDDENAFGHKSYDTIVRLIKNIVQKNIEYLEQVLAFAKRAIKD
jgi:hypothetical protein